MNIHSIEGDTCMMPAEEGSIKRIEGDKYITIEDTGRLSATDICSLADVLEQDASPGQVITLMLENQPEAAVYLLNNGFTKHNTTVFYRNSLKSLRSVSSSYTWKTVSVIGEPLFMKVWEQSMNDSPNGRSTLTMDDHMESVKQELGKGYESSCLTVFEESRPIGIVMPHIEPGTEKEGRIFYFGLVPEERARGKGTLLFFDALRRLKHDFGASSHVGSTSIHNKAMLRLFEKAGGVQERVTTAYKKQK